MTLSVLLLWTLKVPNWIHSQNGWLSFKKKTNQNQRLCRAICSHSVVLNFSSSLPCIDTVLKSRRFSRFAFISELLNLYWKVTNSLSGGWVLDYSEFCHCSDTGKVTSLFVDVVESPYLNKFFHSCTMKNGELFFYCFACISGRPEAKDQVRLLLCFCCFIPHHSDGNIYMRLWMQSDEMLQF